MYNLVCGTNHEKKGKVINIARMKRYHLRTATSYVNDSMAHNFNLKAYSSKMCVMIQNDTAKVRTKYASS